MNEGMKESKEIKKAEKKELLREIKSIFEEEAEKRRWYEDGVPFFDRSEVARATYERIEWGKIYSILKERRRKLLDMLNSLNENVFVEWQEEMYEMWRCDKK